MNILFAGTPDFAAFHLDALIKDGSHTITAVYTQPDRIAGRGKECKPSPVKVLALQHDLPIYQPVNLKDNEVQEVLRSHQADIMIVVAYGLLLPKVVLDIPRYGCLNVHASLLPRWRGAAPIQRAIYADDKETGITIMQMDVGLDTGDMLNKVSCVIDPNETTASLHDKLKELGAPLLIDTLQQVQTQTFQPEIQDDSHASYASKLTKEEAQLDWQQTATYLERCIRTYNPAPVAYSFLNGDRIKFYRAQVLNTPTDESVQPGQIISFDAQGLVIACGGQMLVVQELQIPGKKPMSTDTLLSGYRNYFMPGYVFAQVIQ